MIRKEYNKMKIHHIAITVNNLKQSIDFYTSLFGFKIIKTFERKDLNGKAAFIELNDCKLELWEFEDMKENKDSLTDLKTRGIRHIAFEVDNLSKTIIQLKAKGIHCTTAKLGASGHNYSFLADPNGVAIELYEK